MIYPHNLSPGDKVAIVAPAGRIETSDLREVINVLESWGMNVSVGSHVYDGYNFFSSTDDGRLQDFQKALDDVNVRAIFCARGGYGTGKIIDKLDFRQFLESPKWVIGFSDITLLHLKLHGIGVASLHGAVARQIGNSVDDESLESIQKILFGAEEIIYELKNHPLNIEGNSSAPLIGGNLTLVCNNIGTLSDTEFEGKILFVEEIGERLYAVDRHLNQLERSGRLRDLKGLILGQFTDIKDTKPAFGKSAYEIVDEYTNVYDYPVCFGFESGHERRNLAIPYSFNCDLDVNHSGSAIRFRKS